MKSRRRCRSVKGFIYGGKSRSASRKKTMKGFIYGGKPKLHAKSRSRRSMKSFIY